MADTNQRLAIPDLRSGRNGVDPPQAMSDTHCAEALNVDWYGATVGRKRNGVASVTTTSSPFTGTMSSVYRHVPGTNEALAELWATDDAGTPHIGRLAGGTVWAEPTLKDAPTGNGWDVAYASFNGLLYIAYQSAVDRLHVWDPVLASVRRTGLAAPGILTSVVDTGVGTYAADNRWYRERVTEQRAGVTVRRSEPSASASSRPAGTGTAFRITHGTLPGEGETHWELEASTDDITYYRIATTALASTYDDSAAVSTYASNPLSAATGTYTLQKSYRFIAVDQARVLGFGSYTSTDPQNRVEFSAILGSSDISDGERVPTGNYQGLDENDSGPATALVGPVNGSFFPGKYRQFWKMTPTGNPNTPYSLIKISPVIGPIAHAATVIGEDETGNAALYFQTFRGPYRWGLRGLEYLGKVMEDRILGSNGGVRINLAATKVVAHSRWYPDKRQVFFWWATGSANDPNEGGLFSVGRTPPYYGGYGTEPGDPSRWSRFDGGLATARCSVLFSNTIGATMSKDLKPYIGSTAAVNTLGKADTGTQDLSANYRGYLDTKVYVPWGAGWSGSIMAAQVVAAAQASVTLTLTVLGDFGAQSQSDTISLTAAGTETRVQPRVGGAIALSNIQAVQFRVGDASAANTTWQVDSVVVTYHKEGPVAA